MTTSRRHVLLMGAGITVAALGPGMAQAQASPRVRLETSLGAIVLELDAARAPATVANFLQYVREGHYDGTLFHRVIPGFMIQGGGFAIPDGAASGQMRQKPTRAPIALESRNGLRNQRGTIAMARTSAPDSATSQFFINVVDNPMLDAPNPDGHGYAVFGRVVEGMAVVDRIRAVPTTTRAPHRDVPTDPVLITRARVES